MNSLFNTLTDKEAFSVLKKVLGILRHKEKYYSMFTLVRKRRNQADLCEIFILAGEKFGIAAEKCYDFCDEVLEYLATDFFRIYFGFDAYLGITRKRAIPAINYVINDLRQTQMDKRTSSTIKTRKLSI